MFLTPPASALGSALQADGAQSVADGDAVLLRAQEATDVTWCGARFALPAGARLRLEPQLGSLAPTAVAVPPTTR
jgi:hypothetical protein